MLSPMVHPQSNTYAISISTFLQHRHFQAEANAELFIKTLLCYRQKGKFQLHGFAIMPDHVHLLITPASDQSLPKCIQLIKGGYSFAARTITPKEIWHISYHEHRIRDYEDYDNQLRYIANNPPSAKLASDYRYVHTHPENALSLDACPQQPLR
jgi:putative transposase